MINNVNTLTILMKEMLKNISKMLSMILIVGGLVACNAFSDSTDPYAATEALKDLSGVWKLKSVVRNDVDITKEMDFTQFALHMNSDGTFHIDNYLPFVVSATVYGVLMMLVIRSVSPFKKRVCKAMYRQTLVILL